MLNCKLQASCFAIYMVRSIPHHNSNPVYYSFVNTPLLSPFPPAPHISSPSCNLTLYNFFMWVFCIPIMPSPPKNCLLLLSYYAYSIHIKIFLPLMLSSVPFLPIAKLSPLGGHHELANLRQCTSWRDIYHQIVKLKL